MVNNFPIKKTLMATSVVAAMATQGMAFAATQLEEVMVTATKRTTSLQDTPISITAIQGDRMAELGINSSIDLVKVAPGLKVSWQGNFPSFKMRGGGVAGLNGDAVPLYTNGLSGGTSWAGWLDVERVEVMRGPQGTLYGKNTLGGLVNIVHKKPSTEAFDYGAAATVGEYDLRKLEGFVNVPLADNLAIRLTASQTEQDPLIENKTNSDGGLRDEDNSYVRLQVMWEPTDMMDVNLTYAKWDNESMGSAAFGYHFVGIPINAETGRSNGFGDYIVNRKAPINGDAQTGGRTYHNSNPSTNPNGHYKTSGDFDNFWDAETETVDIEFNWDVGFADLTVKGRHTESESFNLWDVDAGVDEPGSHWSGQTGLADGNISVSENDQVDIVLNSKSDQDLRWTVGYYWSDAWDPKDNNGTYVWAYVDDKLNANTLYPSWTYWDTYGSKSTAIYANAEYDLTDDLTISAGVRRQEDSTFAERFQSDRYTDAIIWDSYLAKSGSEPQASWYNNSDGKTTDNDVSHTDYKLAFNYAYTDDVNVYGSFSTGYIPGKVDSGNILDPNELDAFELGMKTEWADGTVRLNAALYHSEYTNLSYTVFESAGASILSRQETGGGLTSKGIEFDLQWQPTDELIIAAGLVFDDTELDEYQVSESIFMEAPFVEVDGHADGGYYPVRTAASGSAGDKWYRSDTMTEIARPSYDLGGEEAAFSPSYIVNLDVSYRVDLGELGALIPGVTMYHQADYKTMNANYMFAEQEGYTTFDLRATWVTPVENLEVKAYLNNATDELYKVSQNAFSGGRIMADYGRQRQWGVRVGYNF